MKNKLKLLFLLFLFSCNSKDQEQILLGFEKDLIPEGIAIDMETKSIFLNSLTKDKIVKCKLDGSAPTDFIKSKEYGYLSGFGMTIQGDILYALGNSLPKSTNQSILLLLDKYTGEIKNSYAINDTSFIYLNDLAVSTKNDIYITDSNSNKVYSILKSDNQLKVFFESDEIKYPNGIAISNDNKYLFIASFRKGIRVIDLNSKKVINSPNKEYGAIDGMKYYQNSLIGIVNAKREDKDNGIYRFFLNPEGNEIIKKEKLIPYQEGFQIPTTLDIKENNIYFTINSQLDNLDQETNQIIDQQKLTSYMIMKKRIL